MRMEDDDDTTVHFLLNGEYLCLHRRRWNDGITINGYWLDMDVRHSRLLGFRFSVLHNGKIFYAFIRSDDIRNE